MQRIKIGLAAALLALAPLAHADVPTSREYKVLLNPLLFADHPKNASNDFLDDLKTALNSVGFDRDIDGDFDKDKERTVRFYDSPGSCLLRAQSYSFRERDDGDDRESTLKFRSSSQSAAAAVTIEGDESDAESKFEMDVTPPAVNAYSRSTKQTFSYSKNLNKLDDVYDLYPVATGLNVDPDEPMDVVGNLSIWEKTYDGPDSDLGQQAAEFSVTLWYLDEDDDTPVVAEASFKVEEEDGDFTTKVTQRSQLIFNTMAGMSSWTAPNATPKTTWVYQYDPSFCGSGSSARPARSGSSTSTVMPF